MVFFFKSENNKDSLWCELPVGVEFLILFGLKVNTLDLKMTTEIYRAVSIIEERVFEGNVFPFTLTSSLRKDIFCNELKSNDNRLELDNLLRNHKAVLFRDIQGLTSAEDFNDIITATGYLGMDYIGGAAVRTQLTDRVFTANESPASEVIPFHHEMAQTPHPPTHLFFFCERPPTTGGETPILISSIVYQRMVEKHPLFMAKLEELGVKYVRFLPEEDDPTSAIGRGWRSTFLCQDRGEQLNIWFILLIQIFFLLLQSPQRGPSSRWVRPGSGWRTAPSRPLPPRCPPYGRTSANSGLNKKPSSTR